MSINESIADHNIYGPYAILCGMPAPDNADDKTLRQFNGNLVLFFGQLNLLREVYENQDILGPTIVAEYESWARNVFGMWINKTPDARKMWDHASDCDDLFGPAFDKWAKNLFSLTPLEESAPTTGT